MRYDAGILNTYGGGDIQWWQDYIRGELERAHEFYTSNFDSVLGQAIGLLEECHEELNLVSLKKTEDYLKLTKLSDKIEGFLNHLIITTQEPTP